MNNEYVFETSTYELAEFGVSYEQSFDSIFEYPEGFEDPDNPAKNVQVFRPVEYEGFYVERTYAIKNYMVKLYNYLEARD
ncbi:MAG: hypothetical protein MJE77_18820 [Proteobacteria bacterium]|nr:hypothetical protein [Pseudomonadota bacterium]